MRIKQLEGSHAEIQFSVDELVLLNNSLNEVCNGIEIHVDAFQTRLGASREYAQGMLDQFSQLIDQLSPTSDDPV